MFKYIDYSHLTVQHSNVYLHTFPLIFFFIFYKLTNRILKKELDDKRITNGMIKNISLFIHCIHLSFILSMKGTITEFQVTHPDQFGKNHCCVCGMFSVDEGISDYE